MFTQNVTVSTHFNRFDSLVFRACCSHTEKRLTCLICSDTLQCNIKHSFLSSKNLNAMNKRDMRNMYEGVFVSKQKRYLFHFLYIRFFLFNSLYIKQKLESTMSKYLHQKWRQNDGEKCQKLNA